MTSQDKTLREEQARGAADARLHELAIACGADYDPADESVGILEDSYHIHGEGLRALAAALAPAAEAVDKLQAFKDYVHGRLDGMGAPVDPESPHKAAGCRVGGRLDWVEQRITTPQPAPVVDAVAMLAGLLSKACELLGRCDHALKWAAVSPGGDESELIGDIAGFDIENEAAAEAFAALAPKPASQRIGRVGSNKTTLSRAAE